MLRIKITTETDDFQDKYSIWKPLSHTELSYEDADDFEFYNQAFAFKLAEIIREEYARIAKERFLRENPELRSDVVIDELTASTPF